MPAAVGKTMATDDGSSVAVKGYEKLELSTGRCDGFKTDTCEEDSAHAKSTTELALGKAGVCDFRQGNQELQRRGVSQESCKSSSFSPKELGVYVIEATGVQLRRWPSLPSFRSNATYLEMTSSWYTHTSKRQGAQLSQLAPISRASRDPAKGAPWSKHGATEKVGHVLEDITGSKGMSSFGEKKQAVNFDEERTPSVVGTFSKEEW